MHSLSLFNRYLCALLNDKMKAIKRKFLAVEEILNFNISNNFEIVRYFNANDFNLFEKDNINLWFDHSYEKIADVITVEAIYLDYSKKIEKYETVEYIELFEMPLPKEGILKHNEFSISIKTKEDTKLLWKIRFKIKPKIESDLHISLS